MENNREIENLQAIYHELELQMLHTATFAYGKDAYRMLRSRPQFRVKLTFTPKLCLKELNLTPKVAYSLLVKFSGKIGKL